MNDTPSFPVKGQTPQMEENKALQGTGVAPSFGVWISAQEYLPSLDDCEWLTYFATYTTAFYSKEKGWEIWDSSQAAWREVSVDYWMPLPNPPKPTTQPTQ